MPLPRLNPIFAFLVLAVLVGIVFIIIVFASPDTLIKVDNEKEKDKYKSHLKNAQIWSCISTGVVFILAIAVKMKGSNIGQRFSNQMPQWQAPRMPQWQAPQIPQWQAPKMPQWQGVMSRMSLPVPGMFNR